MKILILGKLGSKPVFWKAFHLIFMHVIHKIQCFEEFLHYFALFFKKLIFPEFRSIEIIFWPIEIVIKNVCESLSISISARLVLDQSKHFRPIKNRIENFLKIVFHVFKLTFSKNFQLFLSLYDSIKAPIWFFVIFHHSKAGKTFIPFLLHLFSLFMH